MKRWEELSNGEFKLTILPDDPEDQSPPSVYRGTKDQIAELLANSQEHANRRISELKRGTNGHGAPPAPKPLTPAERMQTVADLTDPSTVDTAITRVMESVMGPMDEERNRRRREEQERNTNAAVAAAESFASETPEWYPTDHNKQTLVRYMQTQGMNPANRAQYTEAFEYLTAAQLLQPKPSNSFNDESEPEDDEPERNAPAPVTVPRAPSRISTGITRSDISGMPPRPTTRLKYTREQLAEMSASTYKNLMQTDSQELARCEEFYAKHPARRAG